MGNWSCLYHWIEFDKSSDAHNAYSMLNKINQYFDKISKEDKWAVGFGFLDPFTLQIVSCQKWGLDQDIPFWVCKELGYRAIVQSGIDRHELFSVHGSPLTVIPLFDMLCFNWNLIDPEKLSGISSVYSCCSVQLKKPVCFSLAHFDQDTLNMTGAGSKLILLIIQDFIKQSKVLTGRVAFGRKFSDILLFFGELYIEKNNTFSFEFTGCYNELKEKVQLGTYQTPLNDEPCWEENMLPLNEKTKTE